MATESVNLVIGAQDNATAVLNNVGNSINRVERGVQSMASGAAEGGRGVQQLISQFVGGDVAAFADQLVTASEQLTVFNAENGKSIKGATLLKAGLAAVVAVAGFKFGQWLIGATQLNEDFNDSLERSKELAAELANARSRQSSQQQFELTLIKDPDQQRAKIKELIETAQKNLAGAENSARSAKQQFEEMNTTFNSWTGNKILEVNRVQADLAQEKVSELKDRWMDLQQQLSQFDQAEAARIAEEREAAEKLRTDSIDTLIKKINEEANAIGKTKEELEAYQLEQLKASEADIQALQAAQKLRMERQDQADAVQEKEKQRLELIKQRNQLEAEAQKLIAANRTEQEKYVDESRKLMQLFSEGLIDDATFERAADKLKKSFDEAEGKGKTKGGKLAAIQGNEDRFLTRGGGTDNLTKQLDATKESNKFLADVATGIGTMITQLGNLLTKEPTKTEVVG